MSKDYYCSCGKKLEPPPNPGALRSVRLMCPGFWDAPTGEEHSAVFYNYEWTVKLIHRWPV